MTPAATPALPADWRDFLALTKPRVMTLVVFTAICGLLVAPVHLPFALAFTAILTIALAAGASGALNMWWEAELDGKMKRTAKRPLPGGRMEKQAALHFGVGLGTFAVLTMGLALNWLAAAILSFSIFFYAVVYTIWLKPRTPQNIVIGGAAGAFPPLIGWVAATGNVTLLPVILFLLIFFWTPPHFWALALFMEADYEAAGIPMLPNVAGESATRRQIVLYTIPMAACALIPPVIGMAGMLYAGVAAALTSAFFILALRVGRRTAGAERALFKYSIIYLFALFAALVVDRFV